MDEPLTIFPSEPAASRAPVPSEEAAQRSFRRRLLALLAAGGTAFILTTWFLVRLKNPLELSSSDPVRVVKAQLDALNRGELRAAYDLFSRRFRQQVPFEAYHKLVVTHREMFHTEEIEVSETQGSGERAVLETRLLAAGGKHYRARFTLVRAEGRWWIDDVRWGTEPGFGQRIAI
jgi:hypothetical protein